MERRKPTQRDLDLMEKQSVASQLPVRFENRTVWNEFQGKCRGCDRVISDEHLRGTVIRQTPRCFTIEAGGYCAHCHTLTRFLVRLHDDMTASGPMDGAWRRWEAEPPGIYRWLRRLLKIKR